MMTTDRREERWPRNIALAERAIDMALSAVDRKRSPATYAALRLALDAYLKLYKGKPHDER